MKTIEMSEELLAYIFHLKPWVTQKLDGIEAVLRNRALLSDDEVYEMIFVTRRCQGGTTREKVELLTEVEWRSKVNRFEVRASDNVAAVRDAIEHLSEICRSSDNLPPVVVVTEI